MSDIKDGRLMLQVKLTNFYSENHNYFKYQLCQTQEENLGNLQTLHMLKMPM